MDPNPKDPPETPELVRWLSEGRHNTAVITDYAIMESVSGDAITNLVQSLAILRQFPDQFVLTHPTGEIAAMDLRAGKLAKLIDVKQTADFHKLCVSIERHQDIPEPIKASIREQATTVEAKLSRLVENTNETVGLLSELWNSIGKGDAAAASRFSPLSDQGHGVLKQGIYYFAKSGQEFLNQAAGASMNIEIRSSFSFKYALACMAQRLDYLSNGPPKKLSPMNLRNNTIDANYVAFGLIFGGFMSGDGRAMRTYRMAKWLEKHLFAVDDPPSR